MVKKLIQKIRCNNKLTKDKNVYSPQTKPSLNNVFISAILNENYENIQTVFKNNFDINIRTFDIGENLKKAFIVSFEGIGDKNIIDESILRPLMIDLRKTPPTYEINILNIKEYALNVNGIKVINSFEGAIDGILAGNTILFLDGEDTVLEIGTRAVEHRNIELPQTENVVKGPHEGFIEALIINTALLRRTIKNPNLKIEKMKIGSQNQRDVCIVFIEGIADAKIVEEVKQRLKSINIDAVLDAGYIEAFIDDAPLSPFPTVGNTEKPDKLASKILEGRVGILVDGSPTALTVPFIFIESFQASEDYYSRPIIATQIRVIRYLSFHISLFLPGIFVALSSYYPKIVPERLFLTMQVTREGTPFTATVEATIMLFLFEILKEAGVRMPRPMGQTVSIVGALVLGEVAVSAGLVSPIIVIVISSAGIMGFLVPPLYEATGVLRFPIMIIASILGLFGVVWCYIFMLIHMVSLHSFGKQYMYPFMPFTFKDIKDTFIRVPLWIMKTRPNAIGWKEAQQLGDNDSDSPQKSNRGG